MKAPERPLLNVDIDGLLPVFEQHRDNPAVLLHLLYELSFRSTNAARDLNRKVILTLMEVGGETFRWPDTKAVLGNGTLDEAEWPNVGLLRHMGYRTGRSGKRAHVRRKILDRVYTERALPRVHSHAYMREWGDPNSATRLRKMAHSIAAFVRNNKRKKGKVYRKAIKDWEDDLRYLKRTYYNGRYDFPWPTTFSRKS